MHHQGGRGRRETSVSLLRWKRGGQMWKGEEEEQEVEEEEEEVEEGLFGL